MKLQQKNLASNIHDDLTQIIIILFHITTSTDENFRHVFSQILKLNYKDRINDY